MGDSQLLGFKMELSDLVDEVYEHAKEVYPSECCGLAIIYKGKLKYIRCTNLLSGDIFCIDPVDYIKAEEAGEIVAVCHSHVNGSANPSDPDIISCNSSDVPWLIVSYPEKNYSITNPTGYKQPLIGRPFFHGVLDCYSLIRDYYKEILNINLNDYLREPNWWEKDEYDLYEDNFKKEGFSIVNDGSINTHDIILMQHGSPKINHGAIYIGDNLILHHSTNRLSSRDVYGGYWRKNTRCIIRHETLL